MRTRSMRDTWRSAMALVAFVVFACAAPASSPPPTGSGSALFGPFGAQAVQRTIDMLATAGIPVRVRPSDGPLAQVNGTARVRLLRFQARNLALEASVGAGTLGSDLDAYAAEAGTQPIAPLIAGWARTANTAASRAAMSVIPGVDQGDPGELVIPGVATMLFLSDVVGTAPTAHRLDGSQLAAIGGPAVAQGDFCGQVSEYLSASLADVFDPDLTLEPRWLADAIRIYSSIDPDPGSVRKAVGALALLAFATSISRPWVATLSAVPHEVHYIVGDDELTAPSKSLQLVVVKGEESIAEEAAECAALADVELAEGATEGTPVVWVLGGLEPHAVDVEGDLELEDRGQTASAGLEYQTRSETEEAHREGTLRTTVATVGATVPRQEIQAVEDVVTELLTSSELGVSGAAVAGEYARLQPVLKDLLFPRSSARVAISWHEGPEETPKPSSDASPEPDPDSERIPCIGDCAMSNGDPHIVTVDNNPYDFQAAGEFVLLRSTDGAVEVQARQVALPGSPGVTINSAMAARVDGRRVGVYVQPDSDVLVARIDGAPVDPSQPLSVGSGRIRAIENGHAWEIAFPDGSYAYAIGLGAYGINVVLEPAAQLAAEGRGVMGSFPEGSWAPALPDGTPLAADPPDLGSYWNELYVRFAEAWRVTAETSLFDYDAGQSTATFAVPAYPPLDSIVRLEDLTDEQRAAGEAACADIADPIVRAQCVFDVGVTSDAGWAEGYEATLTLVETGALPSTGARARVVNLYSENGAPVDLDVYAYTWSDAEAREVAALVATVPYGQASEWFNPGLLLTPFMTEPDTKVQFFRRGEQPDPFDPLMEVTEFLGPGTVATISVYTGETYDDQFGLWLQVNYAEHPENPVSEAPADAGLLVTRNDGLRAIGEPPFLYASIGDGCLESPVGRSDPDLPNVQPISNDLVIPVGQHTLTLHEAPLGALPDCKEKAVGPGAPINVEAGDRWMAFPYRLASESETQLLVIPFDE